MTGQLEMNVSKNICKAQSYGTQCWVSQDVAKGTFSTLGEVCANWQWALPLMDAREEIRMVSIPVV